MEESLLSQLENDKYVSQINLQKQQKINEKQIEKDEIKANKQKNRILQEEKIIEKQKIKKEKEDDDQIIDDNEQFLGKDKRQLLQKISQYRQMFEKELEKIVIKKNPTIQELKNYILEFQCIIELSNLDVFIIDGIYSVLNIIEPMTSKTKFFNIKGLSLVLKNNEQFNKLMKQMFLKYNCYSSVSPEYQCILILISSIYLVINKNNNRVNIENYLNEKI